MDPDVTARLNAALADLAQELQALRRNVRQEQRRLLDAWQPYLFRRPFQGGAENLAAYIAMRRHDLRELQRRLATYGLSSLGRSEGHVLPTLDTVIQALKLMLGDAPRDAKSARLAQAMDHQPELLRNTTDLLGQAPAKRHVRIMVTLPTHAASDYPFVRELVLRGMDCARINCAHDDTSVWGRMVTHVRRASEETGRRCSVLMDLAGPRVRVGPVKSGPSVLHVKPKRDSMGRVEQPARIVLDASGQPGRPAERDALGRLIPARAAVSAEWLARLTPGDGIKVVDARGRHRDLTIRVRISDTEVLADAEAGFYLTPGMQLLLEQAPAHGAAPDACSTVCGPIVPMPLDIRVRQGDFVQLTRAPTPGEPAWPDNGGNQPSFAHVPCLPADVFDSLREGEAVLIDEGKIGARIEALDEQGALLRIVRTRPDGDKLHPEKGINFPESTLELPSLTSKDLEDLDFVVEHADIVGYSFVQSGADMDRLVDALAERGAKEIGIVAKIETRRAVHHLPEIIVHGAGRHPFGVMIARGDLAVEIGYERLAEIQEELLWLSEAAYVPVIWATQVLESLVKRGIPSRAEITDAAMAERAECVMINKGPFVLDAIALLDDVVERMQAHQQKKTARLRALHW
jgi:pyruvate kinase